MASHGRNRHLKRIAAPRALPIAKKTHVWLKKPAAGPHAAEQAVPIVVLLREMLGVADTARQAKKLLKQNMIIVDARPVKSEAYPVGLMDTLSITKLGKSWRVLVKRGRLSLQEIPVEQVKFKLCKIMDKHYIRGGKIQLNLHDGRNFLIEKEEDRFSPGDTLKLSLPKQTMDGFLKFEKGALCYIYKGKHSGVVGKLEEVMEREGSKASNARLTVDGAEIITMKDYLFVVDPSFITS